jgi:hypothetical protein
MRGILEILENGHFGAWRCGIAAIFLPQMLQRSWTARTALRIARSMMQSSTAHRCRGGMKARRHLRGFHAYSMQTRQVDR